MYGLDNETNFEFLKNKELEILVFGPFQVIFRLADGYEISIAGEIHQCDPNGTKIEMSGQNIVGCGSLLRFIGAKINDFAVEAPSKLILKFSNGLSIELIDNSDNYESFSIVGKDVDIVV